MVLATSITGYPTTMCFSGNTGTLSLVSTMTNCTNVVVGSYTMLFTSDRCKGWVVGSFSPGEHWTFSLRYADGSSMSSNGYASRSIGLVTCTVPVSLLMVKKSVFAVHCIKKSKKKLFLLLSQIMLYCYYIDYIIILLIIASRLGEIGLTLLTRYFK